MLLRKIEVIYHRPGSSADPLLQRATIGLRVEIQRDTGAVLDLATAAEAREGIEQHGVFTTLTSEGPYEVLLALIGLAHHLSRLDERTLLREGVAPEVTT